ncbi:MAG TPA: GNAT family protein [Gemmatimonadales bacterium]|nr:GNAT family protein [Gemmatimonadales bacterium]
MELPLEGCRVRSWRPEDAASLARHADNRNVWLNVRDWFPHPYTRADAVAWLQHLRESPPETQFAIEVDGEAAGGIGFFLQHDVERRSAEIGYWLGERHWNRGLMTRVVGAVTDYGFATFDLIRIYARVFSWNPASCRVLEKAGYRLEGRLRRAVVKDGHVLDQLVYAKVLDGG